MLRRATTRHNRGRISASTRNPLLGVAPSVMRGFFALDPGRYTLNGSAVSAITNQAPSKPSANADMVQATAADQPLEEIAVWSPSVRSALFDGTTEFMQCLGLAQYQTGTNQPFSVSFVCGLVSSTLNDRFWGWGGAGAAEVNSRDLTTGAWSLRHVDDVSAAQTKNTATTPSILTGQHHHYVDFDGTNVQAFVDGTSVLSSTDFSTGIGVATYDRFTIGGMWRAGAPLLFANIRVAMCAVWSSPLSTAQRQTLQQLVRSKYGTP